MSNRPSICWKCINRENCRMFNKNPKVKVTKCGRFLMKKEDKEIMQALHEFFTTESEVEK